jgi:hypothetical protein
MAMSSRSVPCLLFFLPACFHSSCPNPSPDASGNVQVTVLPEMSFSQAADLIERYNFLVVQINVASPTEKMSLRKFLSRGRLRNIIIPENFPYKTPVASPDADRRAVWEMAMAGGYQRTGEIAKRGTGIGPDTEGGWVKGRGDDTMKMLNG